MYIDVIDMVVRDMSAMSSLHRYVHDVNSTLLQCASFSSPSPYLCGVHPSIGVELLMRVRLGCLSVHERTARFARHSDNDDEVIEGQAPCPACGADVESIAHLMFECSASATARSCMFDIIKSTVDGESRLQQCLSFSCSKKKVARFVSCDFWNDVHMVIPAAVATFLQKAWRIRNACKHGVGNVVVDVDVSSASTRRGADGILAMA